MQPLTQDEHQDFIARMRAAAGYISKNVQGRMHRITRNPSKAPKPDRPKREE